MEDQATVVFTGLAILVVSYILRWRMDPLNSIPTLGGSSLPGLSYFAALNFMRNAKDIIDEGYIRFYNRTYKVAMPDKWLVIASGPKMIDELRRRPDEDVSFLAGVEETIQAKYTLGEDAFADPYHVDIIKEKLTRTLPAVLPEVVDELRLAVQEYIPAKDEGEWVKVTVMPTMQHIVARASNRAFVGLPLCRNEGFLELAIMFTRAVVKDRNVMARVPRLLKPLVGFFVSQAKTSIRRAAQYLKPLVDEKTALMEQAGDDWEDKPNDMLQWIFDEAIHRKDPLWSVAERVLLVNFAAIHTSSTSFTHVIFDLAARPEHLQPLRDEIEPIIASDGWTKAAMGKMWKLDSVLRESQRWNGINLTSLIRKAMRDITLNDGTFIPKGTIIVTAQHPTHRDETNYPDANVFDGFRFARMREQEGEGTKHQFVNTSIEYVPFGHGKHACPGRFFAANELKAMLAYIVLNYDFKLEDGVRPPNVYTGFTILPPMDKQVMFRKRELSKSA
ncbi:cytochrome P450 [Lentinus tigrinus ALCF2SS1-7]|uniref:Cytochrome P450 n=1 Tax=Lentinus tigrinus ALCF2SS1-6 TaxID=1328759 RepID=A0A5C2SN09_9APHY|nr:cytochrome P450 [Lentinus tigrinus ALCF2SS1-6]RPD82820.1 cytochrome P450 [Lentinus tigrinus ALCF2SS1-7]